MVQKYIVGDVVMYHNKIMVVKEPRDGSHFDLSCPKEGLVYDLVDIEEMKPARLTSEILEKNGWMLYHLYYWFVEKECLKLRLLEFDNYTWNACIGDNVIRINMYSVSDLQHLLFGLGLNSEMEVQDGKENYQKVTSSSMHSSRQYAIRVYSIHLCDTKGV